MAFYNINQFDGDGTITAAYTEIHQVVQAVIDGSSGPILRDGNAIGITHDDGTTTVISRPYSEGSILDLIQARHVPRLGNGDLRRYFQISDSI